MSEGEIKARTKGERSAYATGYAQALLDIEKHGTADARKFLRLIIDADQLTKEEPGG